MKTLNKRAAASLAAVALALTGGALAALPAQASHPPVTWADPAIFNVTNTGATFDWRTTTSRVHHYELWLDDNGDGYGSLYATSTDTIEKTTDSGNSPLAACRDYSITAYAVMSDGHKSLASERKYFKTTGCTTSAVSPSPSPSVSPSPSPSPSVSPSPSPSVSPSPSPSPSPSTQPATGSAAANFGWGSPIAAGSDEFNYTGAPDATKWNNYNTSGHHGKGRRLASQSVVGNGYLEQTGLPNGDTGYLSGKYRPGTMCVRTEVRMQANARDPKYHPVLLYWPDSGGNSSTQDEIDFAEGTNDTSKMKFFLHYGTDPNATTRAETTLSTLASQSAEGWHNYAVEWRNNRVTGYLDGVKWFEDLDPTHDPDQPMHQGIQLDWFPIDGQSTAESKMRVDWTRTYPCTP